MNMSHHDDKDTRTPEDLEPRKNEEVKDGYGRDTGKQGTGTAAQPQKDEELEEMSHTDPETTASDWSPGSPQADT